jgi:hypothetical protein
MTITQTVEIPADGCLTFNIPPQKQASKARVIIQFPINEETHPVGVEKADESIPLEAKGQTSSEAFRNALRHANGAWKDNPWTNHLEDVNAIRDEWDPRN